MDTLFHDELAVICSKRNKWARRRGVSLGDLVGEPWVLPHATGFLTKVIEARSRSTVLMSREPPSQPNPHTRSAFWSPMVLS